MTLVLDPAHYFENLGSDWARFNLWTVARSCQSISLLSSHLQHPSTMIRDDDDTVSRADLSGIQSKIISLMTDNTRLKTTVNRQTTLLTALQARLEELERLAERGGRVSASVNSAWE